MKKRISEWWKLNKFTSFLCAIFLAIGILIGLGINWRRDLSFAFDDKINPTDLLQIFVGVLLVWFIANILDKEKQTERNSRDTVQARVRELHSFVDGFSESKFEDNYKYTDATSALKRIDTGIDRIGKLMTATGIEFPDDVLTDVKSADDSLTDLLTNTPVRDRNIDGRVDLEVNDNVCTFGRDRLDQIGEAFDKLKDALLQLEVKVNVG